MGQALPNPVTSVPIERRGGEHFRVGLAEMNGWRTKMEDSHVIHMGDRWGFFGVFDGHGGDECSRYIASRVKEELDSKGLPANDDAVREMVFALDQEFIDFEKPSGSTGTFVIIELPQADGGKLTLRIGNVGDSRILLGTADGEMVEGPGTDGGLTNDHKPSEPGETERINRTGGTVQSIRGVARVNGDLAVSRAFGDRNYKQTGGPGPADRPVTSDPEFYSTECDSSDFLLLVCDGISEGNFANREVVSLAAESLRRYGDPAAAAAAVCRTALHRKSTDNLTCMIVLLSGGALQPEEEYLPGQIWDSLSNSRFNEVYKAMGLRSGLSLAEVVEKRFDLATRELRALQDCEDLGPWECWLWVPDEEIDSEEKIKILKDEIASFSNGPPPELAPGSKERLEWFERFAAGASEIPDYNDDNADSVDVFNNMVGNYDSSLEPRPPAAGSVQPHGFGAVSDFEGCSGGTEEPPTPPPGSMDLTTFGIGRDEEGDISPTGRMSAPLSRPRMSDLLNSMPGRMSAPAEPMSAARLSALMNPSTEPEDQLTALSSPRAVRVADMETLRKSVEGNNAVKWHDRLSEVGGLVAEVIEDDDRDGTSHVRFVDLGFTSWVPTECLENIPKRVKGQVRLASEDTVRQAIEKHPTATLKWHEKISDVCMELGEVVTEDNGDGTTEVQFGPPYAFRIWVPTTCLKSEIVSSTLEP